MCDSKVYELKKVHTLSLVTLDKTVHILYIYVYTAHVQF